MAAKLVMLVEVFLFFFFRVAGGEREHKVHGIVLYPERHSWCQTTAIKQVVASPGYESATIDNNVCVGACYSYSIPKTQPAEPGELIGPYCDSCQPAETKCFHVTLHADGKNTDGARTVQKRVEIITNCSCMSCDTKRTTDCDITDRSTLELPPDLFATLHRQRPPPPRPQPNEEEEEDDTPELLDLAANPSRPGDGHRYKLNAKLIGLLKSIQGAGDGADFHHDREQLAELLGIVEGSGRDLDDRSLTDFVNFVNVNNTEDVHLDQGRLKDVLVGFRKDREVAERHRSFGMGPSAPERTIDEQVEDLVKKYGLPGDFGIEGSRLGMTRKKGSHVGMGMRPVNSLLESDEDEMKRHKHHLGDEEKVGSDLGRLVMGPHGSLALKIEEKLNLNSDSLKPNHEGLVISYKSHPDPPKKPDETDDE